MWAGSTNYVSPTEPKKIIIKNTQGAAQNICCHRKDDAEK